MVNRVWQPSVGSLPASEWDRLAEESALLSHAWLTALEECGCVGGDTGWQPMPLVLEREGVEAVVPAYLKQHSWGEYVFDWAWADAWERAGMHYYPKLVVAVPFTPVSGRRLLGHAANHPALVQCIEQRVAESGLSSAHVLFVDEESAGVFDNADWLLRHGVQFHWFNRGYGDMHDFLEALERDKRKKIRQERRKVEASGVTIEVLDGEAITPEIWTFFFQCYQRTYREHRSSPYLSQAFFLQVGATMARHMVMFLAKRDGVLVAASLCVRDGDRLHGRYWGAIEEISCLHFELCYYQGIEYAIRHGLSCFEGGAQGEHKLARGFEPVKTFSAHFLQDTRFRSAVYHWLERERSGVDSYLQQLFSHSAYKNACQQP